MFIEPASLRCQIQGAQSLQLCILKLYEKGVVQQENLFSMNLIVHMEARNTKKMLNSWNKYSILG